MQLIEKYFTNLNEQQLKQFAALKDLYKEWNDKINVISRKDIDNFYEHHVLYSLSIATQFEFTKNMQVMDLGCGGGFPSIPLAIFFPETHFFLVDSIKKKLHVVTQIATAINLQNITTQHTRAEDIKNKKFDAIISRAVAPLKDLWHWSKPLLQKNKNSLSSSAVPNGLICLKGGDLTKEIYESACKPIVWEIDKLFNQVFFTEKVMLYVKL